MIDIDRYTDVIEFRSSRKSSVTLVLSAIASLPALPCREPRHGISPNAQSRNATKSPGIAVVLIGPGAVSRQVRDGNALPKRGHAAGIILLSLSCLKPRYLVALWAMSSIM